MSKTTFTLKRKLFGGGFAGSGSSSSAGHFQQPDFTKFGSGNNPKPNENGEGDLPF